ncbi:MAG: hypothetical protein JW715_01750 [Sedimentisphaerales bacterium]|nr:hypothetical protein [Sedimentisphaerales bacterium]
MNKQIKTLIYIFAALFFSLQQCKGSFFDMALEQDSIYTPGKINLTMRLTDKAKLSGPYHFEVSMYITGTLFRKQTIKADQNEPVVYELNFPEVFSLTNCRSRCELFIGEDFIEAREKPFTLWPLLAPYTGESVKSKQIWTFDTSGRLQELFGKLEVKTIDATFQAARDFGSPDIVFIGQHTDPNNMRLIFERLVSVKPKPVIIYLKQKQFLKETKVTVPVEDSISRTVGCSRDNPFLLDLNFCDILSMVDKAKYLKIKKDENSGRTIRSFIYEQVQDEKNIYSYVLTIQEGENFSIYCQLPVTDGNDPRYAILLKNILSFADSVSNEMKRKAQASNSNEREKL